MPATTAIPRIATATRLAWSARCASAAFWCRLIGLASSKATCGLCGIGTSSVPAADQELYELVMANWGDTKRLALITSAMSVEQMDAVMEQANQRIAARRAEKPEAIK